MATKIYKNNFCYFEHVRAKLGQPPWSCPLFGMHFHSYFFFAGFAVRLPFICKNNYYKYHNVRNNHLN
jgi:hypothetical protein